MNLQGGRAALVRMGVRIEIFTVLWMVVEADVASLLFLFWLVGETREALEEARERKDVGLEGRRSHM